MEGYHCPSVGSPNETPIVTSLNNPIGTPLISLTPIVVLLCGLSCSLITPFVRAWEVGGRGGVGWLQRRACVPG